MARYIPSNLKHGKRCGIAKKYNKPPDVSGRPKELRDRYRLLVDTYFKNRCDMAATLRELKYSAGYMDRVFRRPDVRALIEKRQKEMQEAGEVNFEFIMSRYKKLVMAVEALSKYKKVDAHGRLYHDFRGATQDELLAIGELTTEERKEGRGAGSFYVMKMKISERDYLAMLRDMRKLGGFDKADESDKMLGEGLSLIDRVRAGLKRAGKKESA